MKTFRPARKRIDVSVGESVRIIRELQGYSQNELAWISTDNYLPKCGGGFPEFGPWSSVMVIHSTKARRRVFP
jgi:hypothetical protein